MKWINYTRFTGDDLDVDAEDLMQALADYFLGSGFDDPYSQFYEYNPNTMEMLKRMILEALRRGDMFEPEKAQRVRQQLDKMSEEQLEQLLNQLAQKLIDEGYLNVQRRTRRAARRPGGRGLRRRGAFRDHRQIHRLPRLPHAQGFDGRARPRQLRRARYPRLRHRQWIRAAP